MAENENVISRRKFLGLTGGLIGGIFLAGLGMEIKGREEPFDPLLNHLYKLFEFKSHDLNIYTNQWKAALLMLKTDTNKSYNVGSNFEINYWVSGKSYSYLIQKTQENGLRWDEKAINEAYQALSLFDPNYIESYAVFVDFNYRLVDLIRSLQISFSRDASNSKIFNILNDEITSSNTNFSVGRNFSNCYQGNHRIFFDKITLSDGNVNRDLDLQKYTEMVRKFDPTEPILK